MKDLTTFYSTLQVMLCTSKEDIQTAEECYPSEWYAGEKDFYKIVCSEHHEYANGDTVYFFQNRDTKQFFMFFERSEFESKDLKDMLTASRFWLLPEDKQ